MNLKNHIITCNVIFQIKKINYKKQEVINKINYQHLKIIYFFY